MTDDVLSDQILYYRQRADEYDATAYGDVTAARADIARLVAGMGVTGRLLEIACGTGLWTEALAGTAASVTAIDAAPEAVAIARSRVPAATFEVADVFTWRSDDRFDVVFFSAWLSHVPSQRFADFWRVVRDRLAPGGRAVFIDEHTDERPKETYVTGRDEIVERRLTDGRTFRIVKNFVDPAELTDRLRALGWRCTIRRANARWILGEAQPAPAG